MLQDFMDWEVKAPGLRPFLTGAHHERNSRTPASKLIFTGACGGGGLGPWPPSGVQILHKI